MLLRLCEMLKQTEGMPIPFFGKYLMRTIGRIENRYIKKARIPDSPLNNEPREQKVIVSLTSFPARIDGVEYAVKSLMLQDFKPDRIVLWLSDKQFKGRELPQSLLDLREKGLEICYCDDLRGHKKYFEMIKAQKPDELIVTYDDDIIYPHNSLKKLMKMHKKYPRAVIANRGYEITFSKDGELLPHKKWKLQSRYGIRKPKRLIHMSNGSGVLYPYGALYKDVNNEEVIRKYVLGIDDLWMTVMTLLNHTDIVKTTYAFKTFTNVYGTQEFQLGLENMRNPEKVDRYDIAVSGLCEHYPELKRILRVENK